MAVGREEEEVQRLEKRVPSAEEKKEEAKNGQRLVKAQRNKDAIRVR
jgi:hypothetical protein